MLTILLNLIQNKWFWIILLILGFGYWTYNLYAENQRLKYEKAKTEQNVQAEKDLLTKARDSLQTMAASVENLNQKNGTLADENNKTKNEYRALKARYDIAIANINAGGVGKTACTDSVDTVKFSGKKDIASFSGQTITQLKTCTSTWNLDISFDAIDVRSQLYFDETDNLWKMKTISMSPGVTLRGISTIDEETFKKMKGVPNSGDGNSQVLGIGMFVNKHFIAPGFMIKPSRWMFGAHYIISSDVNIYNTVYDRLTISIHWFPF